MKFADLGIHPALASALAGRGYETATPVQAAILDPGAAGRDLIVSSQTGSGKTVAFGAALAATLLPADDSKMAHGKRPVGLAIVPTRELAAQVREELRWLLHGTNIRLASFTGGTDVSGDLRTLQRGVDLAIGTPGRLVDLIRRTRLDLADLKVVVLDEADEMLDLGFREDLETLLQAAPPERRTLLLSATLPPEIRALARRYQRDALAIDARKAADADGGITYRAHLIAAGDRLAATVNVLRADGGGQAIVFCTTREGVSEMHAALAARGFAVTAISGERSQAERDRALDQLRRGELRVLVATNVAARGLHLPDVDLIVHADLPLNADSLIHRSGRTGRAGRKGTAVLFATVAERRKAERLLATAQVKAPWTPPPSAAAIDAAARERFAETLLAEASPAEADAAAAPAAAGADELLVRLEGKLPARDLLRRLLARELARLPGGEPVRAVAIPSDRPSSYQDGPPPPRRPREQFSRAGVLFRVNLGAKQNADPRWLLPLICRRGGVTRNDVGAIRIGPNETQFQIAGEAAADFAVAARERDPRALHVVIEPIDEAGRHAGPPASTHPPRSRETHPPRSPAHPPRPHAAPAPRPHAAPAPRPHAAPAPRPHAAPAPRPAAAHPSRSQGMQPPRRHPAPPPRPQGEHAPRSQGEHPPRRHPAHPPRPHSAHPPRPKAHKPPHKRGPR